MSASATFVDGLHYRVDGRVASIRLDRADRMNLLTREILATLLAIASELAVNDEVSVLTVTGDGATCFSTGILTPALRGSLDKPDVLALIRLANAAFDALEGLPQIVVAGLNGYCRAGAVELALACDIRIAGSHATLMSPEAKWGGFPGAGAPVRLPALIGMAAALEFLCTGREMAADEMHRLGLVQRIVAPDGVDAALDELARTIAANGPLATRGIKRIGQTRMASGFRAARDLSDEMRAALEWTHDVDEGIAAVRDGRPPHFLGR
jgi:enoyl-CoA hydratase/carnithine racemase